MFKKIKEYIQLQRIIQIEVIETLIHICSWLHYDSYPSRNPYARYMDSHAKCLMNLSDQLRKRGK